MAGPENTNQKIEATTENVDVSQKNQDFMKDRDLLKKDESEAISEDASALAEIEKQLDSGGAKNEKQAEILKDMKDWLKKY